VESEYETQMSGRTRARDSEAVIAGQADNPPYALSVVSRKIGSSNRFNASIIDLEGGNQIAGQSEQYATLRDGMNAIELLARELSGMEVSAEERRRRASSVTSAANAAETQAENAKRREQNEKRRAENREKFLKSSGMSFSGWIGLGLHGDTNSGPSTDYVDKEDGKTKSKKETSFSGGLDIQLILLRFFGIQTGLSMASDYIKHTVTANDTTTNKFDVLRTVQIPIVARINVPLGDLLFACGFGGVALNLSSLTDDAQSLDPASMSFICGGELGIMAARGGFRASLGYRYNGDLGESTARYTGAAPVLYQRNHGAICATVGYYIPFK
jgi:hypothetical protein